MSTFLYLLAAAAAQSSASGLNQISTSRQPHNAAYSTNPEGLESRNLRLISAMQKPHLVTPSLCAVLLFFIALPLGYLMSNGLHVNADPVRRHGHIHVHRATHQVTERLGQPQTRLVREMLQGCVQDPPETFQPYRGGHTPLPTSTVAPATANSIAMQMSRRLNWFYLLNIATLLALLSGLTRRMLGWFWVTRASHSYQWLTQPHPLRQLLQWTVQPLR